MPWKVLSVKGFTEVKNFSPLQEISTLEDEVIEFTDGDGNQLVWFLQPNEAQFFLAAESLKFKPKPFGKAKTPFTPKHGHSPPQLTPANSNPSLHPFNVSVDSERSGSAASLDKSEVHAQTFLHARQAWSPEEKTAKASGATKKKFPFSKLRHIFLIRAAK